MGAVRFRPERCLTCGDSLPSGVRIDRRYCKPSCRTLAYRIRKRQGAPTRRPEMAPTWAQGSPPVLSAALVTLADIQAQVLRLAHQLEHADAGLRPVSPSEQPEEPSLLERLLSAEAALFDMTQRCQHAAQREAAWQTLESSLRRQLADATAQHAAPRSAAELAKRAADHMQTRWTALFRDLEAADHERKALRAAADRVPKLQAQLQQAADRHRELEAALDQQRRATEETAAAREAERGQARRSAEDMDTLRSTLAAQAQQLQAAEQDRAALHIALERLRSPTLETDPLLLAMKEKVRALHQLGALQRQRWDRSPLFPTHPELTQLFLDPYDETTVRTSALDMVLRLRREFFSRHRLSFDSKPTWAQPDRELDPSSEENLLKQLEREIRELTALLSRIRSGGG